MVSDQLAWVIYPKGVHLPGIERSPDLKLVALCDIDPKALKEAQEKYNIPDSHCFTNYQDLINCPDVEAVDISTPNDSHFEIAYAAAMAGKPLCPGKANNHDQGRG